MKTQIKPANMDINSMHKLDADSKKRSWWLCKTNNDTKLHRKEGYGDLNKYTSMWIPCIHRMYNLFSRNLSHVTEPLIELL